ncbi:MAG: V-type ATP synthase subunit I [bacterium]
MAVSKLKKIKLVSHNSFRNTMLEVLQRRGAVHVCDLTEEDSAGKKPVNAQAEEEAVSRLNFSLAFLAPYATETGFLEKLSAGKPVLPSQKLSQLVKETDINAIFEQCTRINHDLKLIDQDTRHAHDEIETTAPWKKLNCPLESLGATDSSFIKTFFIKIEALDGFLNASGGLCVHCREIDRAENKAMLLIAAHRSDREKFQETLETFNLEEVSWGELTGTPAQRIKALENRVKELDQKKRDLEAEARSLLKNRSNLEFLCDYYLNAKHKLEIQDCFRETSSSFILEGWIKESGIEALLTDLRQYSNDWAYEILDSDETPPVVMENKPMAAPFEAVTNMYGLPKYDEVDPTPILAPFFFVFFGLCLADGGYGLILTGLAYWALKKFKLPEESRGMVKLGLYCGIATILAGVVTGSWFGDLARYLPFDALTRFLKGLSLFDPIYEPMIFMALALNLGVFHICTGIYTKFSQHLKRQEYSDAFFGQIPWLLLFLAVELYWIISTGYLSPVLGGYLKWVVYFSLGILFFFGGRGTVNPLVRLGKGFLELYESIAYLSDVLSYSRLLALGLASAVIANVINMISSLVLGVPFLGYLMLAAIMLGGHTFNLLINTLGSFIHTSRLQFVEFFPKFFEGGGKTI